MKKTEKIIATVVHGAAAAATAERKTAVSVCCVRAFIGITIVQVFFIWLLSRTISFNFISLHIEQIYHEHFNDPISLF